MLPDTQAVIWVSCSFLELSCDLGWGCGCGRLASRKRLEVKNVPNGNKVLYLPCCTAQDVLKLEAGSVGPLGLLGRQVWAGRGVHSSS
jgi:hypothetical protein